MKRAIYLVIALAIALLYAVAAIAAPEAAAVVPPESLFVWVQANEKVLLRFALGVSEFLALFKAFQGNGIVDTFIKAIKLLQVQTESKEQ